MSSIRPVIVAAWLAFAPCAAIASGLEEVDAAEAAFAARNLDSGQQAAFLEFLAEDGVLFRPEVVRGREWLATHESATGRLERAPLAVAASCDGRLALGTGRWTYANAAGGEPAGGHYLTVWRQDNEGRWRIALDHRIDHSVGATAQAPLAAAIVALWPAEPPRTCDERAGSKDFAKADAALDKAIGKRGLAAALERAAASGALVYRDEAPPTLLTTPGPASDVRFGRRSSVRPSGTIVEPSADVAVSYGIIAAPASRDGSSPDPDQAIYVRVWNRVDRRWRLAIDLQTSLATDRER